MNTSLILIFKYTEHAILDKVRSELAEHADFGNAAPAGPRDNLGHRVGIYIPDREIGAAAERALKREELAFHFPV